MKLSKVIDGKWEDFALRDSIELFKNLGHGVYFYFYFLKFFGIVFLLIGAISTFLMILNYYGNGLNRLGTTNFIIKGSLGNISYLDLTDEEW